MAARPSPLNELCSALPSLPSRLQEVGRFVAANDYDATTRSMRELATVAGADPAAFTRLGQGDRLFRLGRTARRADGSAAAGAGRAVFRARKGTPRAEPGNLAGVGQAGSRGRGPCAHLARRDRLGRQGAARRAPHLDCRLSLLPQRGRTAQLPASPVSARHRAACRRLRPRRSRSRRIPPRRCRGGDRLCALFHRERALRTRRARLARNADCDCRQGVGADGGRRRSFAVFEAAASPGFFPSLTGAIAIAQSLAAATFMLGGASAKRRLEETEARLADTSQYVTEKG